MSTPTRLGLFAVALAAVFGLALGTGSLVGPVGAAGAGVAPAHADEGSPHDAGHEPPADDLAPTGLQTSQDGHTLVLDAPALPAPGTAEVAFQVVAPDGAPVTRFETSHDEDLHLVAVRRDLTGYQHVHPELAADGTWTTPLDLTPGEWRLFADFVPAGGEDLVLGTDLSVAGTYVPAPLPAPSRTAEVGGYTVTLDGELVPGRESELTLAVARDGRPVTDLQPYLAAYGHLVVLRDGDLAYLHVHPEGEPGDGATAPGPEVGFRTTTPSAGTYRLFLDFRHAGVVRTAEFTAEAVS